jgi:phospholipid/cholesterol/gamma-HCH transport system permease protein
MDFVAELDETGSRLRLTGDCGMADAPVLQRQLQRLVGAPPASLAIDVSSAGDFAIGPTWLLRDAIAALGIAGTTIDFVGHRPEHLAYLDELVGRDGGALPTRAGEPEMRWLVAFGRRIAERARASYEALSFGGRVLSTAATAWTTLKRLRVASVVRHVHETGVQAIPVVAVIAFLISVIAAYIGAQQLRPYGAEIYTVDLVALGVLRELGVLLTAIMVAGRTGSAYAAELGVMKLNDEVDALESMGLNPYEVLVLPRVLALVIALPLLTVVADAMGLAAAQCSRATC